MRLGRRSSAGAAAAALIAALLVQAGPASAADSCYGRRVTISGTGGNDVITGTDGDDAGPGRDDVTTNCELVVTG